MGKTLFSFFGLMVALGIFFFYTKPVYDGAQMQREEIAKYDAALSKAQELQQLKDTLLQRYNEFSPEDRDKLQKLLPDHVDNVRLILDLDNIASRRGMALQNVVVSTPGSGQTTQTAVGTIGSSRQKYETLTTRFSTQGTYSQFQQLISDLEASLRIMDMVNLKVTSNPDSARLSEPFYSYEVTLRTYWLK
jgi:Tfp pilus assembly protein PilO